MILEPGTGGGNWEKNTANQHVKNVIVDCSLHSSTPFIGFEMSFRCFCRCGVAEMLGLRGLDDMELCLFQINRLNVFI